MAKKGNKGQVDGFDAKTPAGKALATQPTDGERAALARQIGGADAMETALVAGQDETLDAIAAEAAIEQEFDAATEMRRRATTVIAGRLTQRVAEIRGRTR